MEYLIYLVLGSVAGLVSGLFGVGGGTVIVPILLVSFAAQGISPSIATHTAIATSLACIAVSSLTAIYTHLQKGVVDWRVVRSFIPGIIIGTLIGSSFFVSIEGAILQVLLGVFLVAIGLQMTTYRAAKMDVNLPRRIYLGLSGISIGGISALFGVGGGMFTTPLLSYYGINIHSAISVAAIGGFCIAITASLIYASTMVASVPTPSLMLGYIYLPAWVGIIITSTPFAKIGAELAHRSSDRQLKKIFGIFLLLLGLRFIWTNVV